MLLHHIHSAVLCAVVVCGELVFIGTVHIIMCLYSVMRMLSCVFCALCLFVFFKCMLGHMKYHYSCELSEAD